MHIHVLGICGTFMGGLALIARTLGHRVTGCDANVYPPMSTQLAAEGIELIEGYGAEQRALSPDLWVVGNAITRGNPLMEAILDSSDRFISGPQWLAEHVLHDKWVLAVAGTHGKTTTASMLAWILDANGLDPGFLIGGVPGNFGISSRARTSRHFVIEADEYDTAFFDKRSKFVHYQPRTAVLNNLEFDHADIFADLAAIETQFHHLVRIVPASGRVIVNGADEALGRVMARGCWSERDAFGTAEGWSLGAVDQRGFIVQRAGAALGRVEWTQLGEHNRLNALAAIAAAAHAGVAPQAAIEALGRFAGAKRRMEVRGRVRDITLYDDFAHHPTAIETTIAGLRAAVGNARILAVLEPRSNTMKLGVMKAALPGSLAAADRVYCFTGGLNWDVAAALTPLGAKALCDADFERFTATIAAQARPGDHILVMSNGGFLGVHDKLLERLRETG